MCVHNEQNLQEAPKTWDTKKEEFYEAQHQELTARADAMEVMRGQRAQLEAPELLQPYFVKSIPFLPARLRAADGTLSTPRKQSRFERKKRRDMEKQYRRAEAAKWSLVETEGSAALRGSRRTAADRTSSAEYRNERAVLNKQLAYIQAQENADLAAVKLLQRQQSDGVTGGSADAAASAEAMTCKIEWGAQAARYEAYHRMAIGMEVGSKVREEAMKKAEDEKMKANVLRQKYKVACMSQGAERKRESDTIDRHEGYDMLKGIFRKPPAYSREDAEMTIQREEGQQLHLVNIGRATMGGTKAMYEFSELREHMPANDVRQIWLFKEATNCIGMSKPEGAIVTAEASRLQRQLRGELSIPAYCVRVNGEVVGSVQKKLQPAAGGVNLFRWQAQDDLSANAPDAVTMHDLMNEHTLDWVLCNFDTKGENFINQDGGHVISFDKEASFNKLLDDGAQAMSYTYKPHSNDTIYNTMFRAYANGTIDLDLYANEEAIHSIESKDAQEYAEMFRATLDAKYKKGSKSRSRAETLLKERFRTLRETYRTFYTALIRERLEHFQGDSEEHRQERERLNAYLRDGTFRFRDE